MAQNYRQTQLVFRYMAKTWSLECQAPF